MSRDKDLLDLMNEQKPEGQEFRRCFPDLRIIDPSTFLLEIPRPQTQPKSPDQGS